MTPKRHISRLSSAFLLLVMLTGWIAAPIVHEIEHAFERAEMAHVHDEHDGVSFRTGCDTVLEIVDECPVSLTHVQAVGDSPSPFAGPYPSLQGWADRSEIEISRPDTYRFVRGPPVA